MKISISIDELSVAQAEAILNAAKFCDSPTTPAPKSFPLNTTPEVFQEKIQEFVDARAEHLNEHGFVSPTPAEMLAVAEKYNPQKAAASVVDDVDAAIAAVEKEVVALEQQPKRRGRPPGSKNAPKDEPSLAQAIDKLDEAVHSTEFEKAVEHLKSIQKEETPAPKATMRVDAPEHLPVNGLPLDLRGVWGLSTPDNQPWRPDHGGLTDAEVVKGLKLGDLRDTKVYTLKAGRFRIAKELATANGVTPVEATEPTPESEQLTTLLMEVAACGVPCLGPDRPREWFEKAAITGLMELYVDLN